MGWQFSSNGQLNWSAAEANWRLVMDPLAATNYEVVEAAWFVGEHRGGRPGDWANDVYTGVSWTGVCMSARDQQDAAEAERDDLGDDDLEVNTQAPDDPPDASDESAYLDLSELAIELGFVVEHHHEDGNPDDDEEPGSPFGTPPGAPPAYRASEAGALAEQKSDDETATAAPVHRRSRYVDGEAAVGH